MSMFWDFLIFFSRGSWSQKEYQIAIILHFLALWDWLFFLEPQSQTWASEGLCALSYTQMTEFDL